MSLCFIVASLVDRCCCIEIKWIRKNSITKNKNNESASPSWRKSVTQKKDDHLGVGEDTLKTVRQQRIPEDIKKLVVNDLDQKPRKDTDSTNPIHYDDLEAANTWNSSRWFC